MSYLRCKVFLHVLRSHATLADQSPSLPPKALFVEPSDTCPTPDLRISLPPHSIFVRNGSYFSPATTLGTWRYSLFPRRPTTKTG